MYLLLDSEYARNKFLMLLLRIDEICIPMTDNRGDVSGILKLIFVMLGKFAITAAYSTIYLYSAEIFPTAVR